MPPSNTAPVNNTPEVRSTKKSPLKTVFILLVIVVVVYGILNALVFKKKNTVYNSNNNNARESANTSEDLGYDPQESVTVTLTADGFSPQTVTIKVGQSITWVNNSGQTATVDSSPHPVHTDFPFLNLGEFQNGETKVLVFPEAGNYKYHDHLNSSNFGSVIVE